MKFVAPIGIIAIFYLLFLSGPFLVSADDGDLKEIKKEIKKVEGKKEEAEKKLKSSQAMLQQNQNKLNLTNRLVAETEEEIERREREIENLGKRIVFNKTILEEYVREMYYLDENPLENLIFGFGDLSEASFEFDQMSGIKEKIISLLEETGEAKKEMEKTREELGEKKEDHEKILSLQKREQVGIIGEIQEAKTTLSQLNSKLESLRTSYSRILGKAVNTKDILEAASFVAKATGMSKSFLLGVLVQESNKGQNVGGCTYPGIEKDAYKRGLLSDNSKASEDVKARTATFKKRQNIFKDIVKDLGYKYEKQPVSCNPSGYKGTGGAMGVPQFMADTWRGWESKISAATGKKNPDPWNLVDGVTAMALKLSADGASKKTRFEEAKSYCVYLAGGNWGSYCFGTDKYKKSYEDVNCWGASIRNYGEKVLCLKDNYEKYYK